jgi:hypothetical protein
MFDVTMKETVDGFEFNATSDAGKKYMRDRFGMFSVGFTCEITALASNLRKMSSFGIRVYSE